MSRSRRKAKVHGITCKESESADKKIWHGRMRAAERDRLIADPESETTHRNEVSSVWAMAKDGKHYWVDMPPEMLRK